MNVDALGVIIKTSTGAVHQVILTRGEELVIRDLLKDLHFDYIKVFETPLDSLTLERPL